MQLLAVAGSYAVRRFFLLLFCLGIPILFFLCLFLALQMPFYFVLLVKVGELFCRVNSIATYSCKFLCSLVFFLIFCLFIYFYFIFFCVFGVLQMLFYFFFISKSWRFVLACKCNCYNCRLLCSLAFFFVVVFVFGVANAILFYFY